MTEPTSDWQELLRSINSSCTMKTDFWCNQSFVSQYSPKLAWTRLFDNLALTEPVISTTQQLSFQTRFSLLPQLVQRNLMVFFQNHIEFVPKDKLEMLLEKEIDPDNKWLELLKNSVKIALGKCRKMTTSESQCENENLSIDEECSEPRAHSWTGQENSHLFTELCDSVEKRDIKQIPWRHNYSHFQDFKGSSKQVNTPESGDSVHAPSTSLEPKQDDEFLEPALKRLKREPEKEISMDLSTCQADVSFSQRSYPLTLEDWEKVADLRGNWHGGCVDKTAPSHMSVLCTATPNQVKEICSELELGGLNETSMWTVCYDICEAGDKLGYTNSLHILSALILPKLEDDSVTLPRFLINIMTRLSKEFPRQIIDGIIIPRLENSHVASSEINLFCKMTRENFTESNRVYLFKKLLEVEILSEGILCLFQVLADLKISLQTADLVKLVPKLRAESISHTDNLNFAKLLFALITKYGNQMDASLIEQTHHIAVENKTFLKKAIITAVLKLKVKTS